MEERGTQGQHLKVAQEEDPIPRREPGVPEHVNVPQSGTPSSEHFHHTSHLSWVDASNSIYRSVPARINVTPIVLGAWRLLEMTLPIPGNISVHGSSGPGIRSSQGSESDKSCL